MEVERTAVFLFGSSILRRNFPVTSVICRIGAALSSLFYCRRTSYLSDWEQALACLVNRRSAWPIMGVLGPLLVYLAILWHAWPIISALEQSLASLTNHQPARPFTGILNQSLAYSANHRHTRSIISAICQSLASSANH